MNTPPLKTIVISALAFALLWPIVMFVSSGQMPSLASWFVAVMIFAAVSGAGHLWRKSRKSHSE